MMDLEEELWLEAADASGVGIWAGEVNTSAVGCSRRFLGWI